jgi:hypothetical protein
VGKKLSAIHLTLGSLFYTIAVYYLYNFDPFDLDEDDENEVQCEYEIEIE